MTIGLTPEPDPIGHVSPTVANSLLVCPLRVAFSRDRRLASLALRPKPDAILGTASHVLAEAVARGEFDDIAPAEITDVLAGRWDQIVQAQEDALRDLTLLGPVPDHHRWPFYEIKRAAAISYATLVLSARQEVRVAPPSRPGVLHVEPEVELECDDPPLTGRIDRIERTVDGIRIVDLKSSLAGPSAELLPAHRVQLFLYCALYKGVYGQLPYEVEIRHFDGTRFVEGVDPHEVDDIVARVLDARDRVNNAGLDTHEAVWWALARADPEVCRYCNYQPVCRPFLCEVANDLPPFAATATGTVVERSCAGDSVRVRVERESSMPESASKYVSVLGIPAVSAPALGDTISVCWAVRSPMGEDLRVNWLSVLYIWANDSTNGSRPS